MGKLGRYRIFSEKKGKKVEKGMVELLSLMFQCYQCHRKLQIFLLPAYVRDRVCKTGVRDTRSDVSHVRIKGNFLIFMSMCLYSSRFHTCVHVHVHNLLVYVFRVRNIHSIRNVRVYVLNRVVSLFGVRDIGTSTTNTN